MRISVFGLGYVGAVSMACLARDGHQVIGVDVDPMKLELLRSGRSPIIEEGVQELTRSVVAAGKVSVTDDVAAAINGTELSLSEVAGEQIAAKPKKSHATKSTRKPRKSKSQTNPSAG